MSIDPRLHRIVAGQPYPLLFATISGAHLYGFPSPDSDFDLRGAHVLPIEKVVGLQVTDETVEDSRVIKGLEMDIVSHDVKKFFGLLLKKNGYVLEQLFSPLVVQTTPEHAELQAICCPKLSGSATRVPATTGVITNHHAHHYFGFAETQWKLFLKESPRRVKPLLYAYRVLLTGIHLMRSSVVEANLATLNECFRLPHRADRPKDPRRKHDADRSRRRLLRGGISKASDRIAGGARREPITGSAGRGDARGTERAPGPCAVGLGLHVTQRNAKRSRTEHCDAPQSHGAEFRSAPRV